MSYGVILYGPPGSGKDTITRFLEDMCRRFQLFSRLKFGPGRTVGYRMVDEHYLAELRVDDGIIWENDRYGATYAVDEAGLSAALAKYVPVLHLGQIEAVDAVRTATPDTRWLVTQLWYDRQQAADRLHSRGSRDVRDRLQAFDETKRLTEPDLDLDTSQIQPEEAATVIVQKLAEIEAYSLPN